MKNLKMLAARGFVRGAAVAGLGLASVSAFAVDGITTALTAVDLSGVATAVGAIALIVVAISLVFKGPDIAKRVIRKV